MPAKGCCQIHHEMLVEGISQEIMGDANEFINCYVAERMCGDCCLESVFNMPILGRQYACMRTALCTLSSADNSVGLNHLAMNTIIEVR